MTTLSPSQGSDSSSCPPASRRPVRRRLSLLAASLILTCGAGVAQVQADEWGLTPLGKNVPPPAPAQAPTKVKAAPTLKKHTATGQPLTLVNNGQSQAVIVTAARPSRAVLLASEELQRVLEKMTGVKVEIVAENQLKASLQGQTFKAAHQGKDVPVLILVGDSQLTQAAGVDTTTFPEEGYILRTHGNALLIVGRDRTARGLTTAGTLHAVSGLLQRHLDCRWLWPGELGEVIPSRSTITIPALNEEDAPAIPQRRMRNLGGLQNATDLEGEPIKLPNTRLQQGTERLGFPIESYAETFKDSSSWFRRHQLGGSLNFRYTHAFDDYWEKYGKDHPEWFALQSNGSRAQNPERERLCKSNLGLIQQIAINKSAELTANPNMDAVSISPNDGSGINMFCMCENCRKLDPPQAPTVELMYLDGKQRKHAPYPALSDRVFWFYSQVAELVAKDHPDRMLGVYAYSYYRTPPIKEKVHPNLLVGFVGLNYFNDAAHERDKQSWERWALVANKLFLRPNLLHGGHGFPANYASRLTEDVRRCYETGLIATDFDSVMHHWSSNGINYYVLAQVLWDPSRDASAIIDDYCQHGFGPAAKEMRAYFDELEKHTTAISAKLGAKNNAEGELREEEADTIPSHGREMRQFFLPPTIARLNELLDKARAAAGDDQTVRQRIDFIALGVRYADLQARLRDPALLKDKARTEGKALYQERLAFFREVYEKHPFAIHGPHVMWREGPVFSRLFDPPSPKPK